MSNRQDQSVRHLHAMGVQVWIKQTQPKTHSVSADTMAGDVASGARSINEKAKATTQGVTQRPDVANLDWNELEQSVTSCHLCVLCESRTQTVFGVGQREADWMIIGEAPGAEEDRRGQPFVGRAGQLLDQMLKSIGLNRETVYIANILKCRPPGNRDPSVEESDLCNAYLDRQIKLVKPRVILAVGRIAAQKLLNTKHSLSRLRGDLHTYSDANIPLVVTYHPAYLLRSPAQKRRAWDDLLLAAKLMREQLS